MTDRSASSEMHAAVAAAAQLAQISLSDVDLAAGADHFALLMGFAAVLGDPPEEPAAVFRP